MIFRRSLFAALIVVAVVSLLPTAGAKAVQAPALPSEISDKDFWRMIVDLSEPGGTYPYENFVSNELQYQDVVPALKATTKPGGVYIGVGPEQNFTYAAVLQSKLAFVIDIRRQNMVELLMYKALFEMSADRADFVSRLFTRKRPSGLTAKSTARELMLAYLGAEQGNAAAFQTNLKAVTDHLTRTRRLQLGADDLAGIEYVYRNFHRFGPAIIYTSSVNGTSGIRYADLMSNIDTGTRSERSYLASEDNFAFVRGLEQKNLIVPVVGDFAGPRALRAVGSYLKDRGAAVTAFYVSNVEMYLQNNGVWPAFCANVATLPLENDSIFIRPDGGRSGTFSSMVAETLRCGQ